VSWEGFRPIVHIPFKTLTIFCCCFFFSSEKPANPPEVQSHEQSPQYQAPVFHTSNFFNYYEAPPNFHATHMSQGYAQAPYYPDTPAYNQHYQLYYQNH